MNKQIKELVISSIILFLFILFSMYINKSSSIKETLSNTFSFIGGSYLMSSLTQRPLDFFLKKVKFFLPDILLNDILEKKKNGIIKKYNKLDFSKLSPIEKRELDLKIFFLQQDEINEISRLVGVLEKQFKIMDYQNKNNKICDPHKFYNNVIKCLSSKKNLNKETKKQIYKNVFKPILNNLTNDCKIPISPIYLYGSSGVGKTTFINNISEELNIPIVDVDPKNLHATGYPYMRYHEPLISTYSELLLELIDKKSDTIILRIDEFDKYLNEQKHRYAEKNPEINTLNFLNVNTKFIFDKCLAYNTNVCNIIVFFIANKKPEDIDESFKHIQDRFTLVEFPDITPEQKNKICLEKFTKEFKSNHEINEHIEAIKQITDNDKSAGLRQVLVALNTYLAEINTNKLFNDFSFENIES
jgi:hypothetical protein